MFGDAEIISSDTASGAATFAAHNANRILSRAGPATGGTVNITVKGTATKFETDAGTTVDTAAVTDAGYLLSLENTPCHNVTVEWDTLTGGGILKVYAFVGGV